MLVKKGEPLKSPPSFCIIWLKYAFLLTFNVLVPFPNVNFVSDFSPNFCGQDDFDNPSHFVLNHQKGPGGLCLYLQQTDDQETMWNTQYGVVIKVNIKPRCKLA